MRLLPATLLAAQMAPRPKPKLVLSRAGALDVTYTESRFLFINHEEYPYRFRANVLLHNRDGALTTLDFKGWTAVLHWGLVTTVGNEYSQVAPFRVSWQQLNSSQGDLTCELTLLGIPDLMDLDRASADYLPLDTDTKTVKTLIREIAGDTGVIHLACFNHTTKYNVVFASEDSLMGTYIPKNSFKIYTGGSRLAALQRLLSYTRCAMLPRADGNLHILVPTTTGIVYDYTYSLQDPNARHAFFSKAYRKALVFPNHVTVRSLKDDAVQFSGTATSAASFALMPTHAYYETSLVSNAQATSIAQAIIFNSELNSEKGAFSCPMNVGQELYDYVRVIDERQKDFRVGNIGSIRRQYSLLK